MKSLTASSGSDRTGRRYCTASFTTPSLTAIRFATRTPELSAPSM
jgi:hypothetical protein